MICPQCNTEYRPGFTRCSDCSVDLIEEPPHYALAGKPPADPGDPNEDPFCSFWRGEDPRIHAELCEILEEAGIPHKTVFRRDHLFNFSNFPAYEVGIPFSRFDEAEKVVQEAYGPEENSDEPGKQELPGLVNRPGRALLILPESLEHPPEDIPGPPAAGEDADWYPEDASENVWSGDADDRSKFLVAALHENGINCRIDQQGTRAQLFVLPHDASQAREIIREIVEGSPPL